MFHPQEEADYVPADTLIKDIDLSESFEDASDQIQALRKEIGFILTRAVETDRMDLVEAIGTRCLAPLTGLARSLDELRDELETTEY